MENLIIYGGSFDPIHNGHLRIARAASLAYNADVLFVPAQTPRWKEPEASAEQRVEMLRLALKENGGPSFSIDLIEINEISEVNYTVNTIKSLKKKYKDREMYFLIGADQVNAFPKWKDPEIIASLVKIVYCPRPGVEIDDSIVERYSMLRLPYDGSGPVSSTAVRNL
ncbi:MAG: nicotinate (nicotinamide) nucleotide adenylyltransferase, partial [Bacilli bacterium]|nr:nicotinate (nicotinamide) nucleotide adenylyltransferase [Bacilli bacterium]